MSADAPYPRLIHAAVSAQARQRPEATALLHGDLRVDYRTLDRAADHYAAALVERGVRPGDVVPVLLPRSPAFVATLLAVLKCGAAYAALDRRWPPARVATIIDTVRPPVVVGVRVGVAPAAWCPDTMDLAGAAARAAAPVDVPVPVDGSGPATVFFTSGTTGTPKGVLSPHRATTRLFGPGTFARFGPGRVMPQVGAVSWDVLSLELWGMLTTGGTVVLPDDDYFLPEDLADLVHSCGVDTLWLTSSLFNLFVHQRVDCFNGLRQVLIGGEKVSVPHVRRFLAEHPEVALINGYGPVESCVFVSTHRIAPADCDLPDGVPVGTVVAGTAVHLLDEDGGPVPAGATGEITVSGDGLAVGYLGEASATAAAFPTVPVDGVPTRVYRTGDLGRYDEAGVLHFRGRRDRQVKIAGHRIEPAEVEAAGRRIPGVDDCAVVPVPGRDGGYQRLALFFTGRASGPDPDEVRRSLAGALPAYLVPGTVHRCDAFPVTANGKLDRAALLASLPARGRPVR